MSTRFMTPDTRMLFYNKVWEIVRKIPAGKVATYGQIASLVEMSEKIDQKTNTAFGARWVGGAMKSCPEDVPWQRVINAQGKISLKGKSGEEQKLRLQQEGVKFDSKDRIDMSIYKWRTAQDQNSQLELPL